MEQMLERSVALKVAVVRWIGQESGLWSVRPDSRVITDLKRVFLVYGPIVQKTRRTLDPSF